MEPDPEPPSNFGTGSTKERPAPSPNTAHLVGNIYLWFNHHPLAIRNTYGIIGIRRALPAAPGPATWIEAIPPPAGSSTHLSLSRSTFTYYNKQYCGAAAA